MTAMTGAAVAGLAPVTGTRAACVRAGLLILVRPALPGGAFHGRWCSWRVTVLR